MLTQLKLWLWRVTGAQAEIERQRSEVAHLRHLCLHYGISANPLGVRSLRGFEAAVERFCREHLPAGVTSRITVSETAPGFVDVAIELRPRGEA